MTPNEFLYDVLTRVEDELSKIRNVGPVIAQPWSAEVRAEAFHFQLQFFGPLDEERVQVCVGCLLQYVLQNIPGWVEFMTLPDPQVDERTRWTKVWDPRSGISLRLVWQYLRVNSEHPLHRDVWAIDGLVRNVPGL